MKADEVALIEVGEGALGAEVEPVLSEGLRRIRQRAEDAVETGPAKPKKASKRKAKDVTHALEETIAVTKQTAEGVKSCQSVADLARRHGVDMPITETVVDIVHNGKPPAVAVKELMSRSAKPER